MWTTEGGEAHIRFEYEVEGRIEDVLIGTDDASLITSTRESVQVTFGGLRGDRHEGLTRLANARDPEYARGTEIRNERQVTVVSREELAEIAERMELPRLDASWVGANLATSGIPRLTGLPPNTRLVFPQNAVLVVQGENFPCRWAGEAIASMTGDAGAGTGFPKAALHRRGLICCVERPGYISVGDRVLVRVPPQAARHLADD